MTYEMERVLADIDADHGDCCLGFLRHGVLLVLSAPCQLLVLAGPEHGRTIPLAEFQPLSRRPSIGSKATLVLRVVTRHVAWSVQTFDANRSVKRAPPPAASDTITSPPCAFIVSLTMARPSPAPSAFGPLPRQNRSKTRSRSCTGTPQPR